MINLKWYDDINKAIFALRTEVYLEEQQIAYKDEFEGDEDAFLHLCMYDDDNLIAYARLNIENNMLRVDRVAVKKEYRKLGFGRKLMLLSEKYAIEQNNTSIELNAQIQARDFYYKLGYIEKGEVFIEANIPHIKMIKKLLSEN